MNIAGDWSDFVGRGKCDGGVPALFVIPDSYFQSLFSEKRRCYCASGRNVFAGSEGGKHNCRVVVAKGKSTSATSRVAVALCIGMTAFGTGPVAKRESVRASGRVTVAKYIGMNANGRGAVANSDGRSAGCIGTIVNRASYSASCIGEIANRDKDSAVGDNFLEKNKRRLLLNTKNTNVFTKGTKEVQLFCVLGGVFASLVFKEIKRRFKKFLPN